MISFKNVSVSFDRQQVLKRINLQINKGEFVSLVGETGVGKTTLLRLIYFDLFPESGEVIVGEFDSSSVTRREIPKLRRQIGIVFQDFKLLEDRNIYENIAFTLEVTGAKRAEISSRVLRALADVHLSHKRNSLPHELSGGEQQRVVIARAIINDPFVLLVDEPTGNLDPATSMEILQLLLNINAKGTAILLSTHNYELVRKSKSRILQIREGKVEEVAAV
jgi:cell division transport system ATP-binding protein